MPTEKKPVFFDRTLQQFVGLDDEKMLQLSNLFPGVNIELELKKMALWLCDSNLGKKRVGTMSFIAKWLGKVKAPVIDEEPIEKDHESMLGKAEDAYMEQLWKGREHLLAMNKMRKG